VNASPPSNRPTVRKNAVIGGVQLVLAAETRPRSHFIVDVEFEQEAEAPSGAAYRATRGVYGAPNSLMIEIESRLSRTQNPLSGIRTKAYCALTEI
jgi:hypothetical protein